MRWHRPPYSRTRRVRSAGADSARKPARPRLARADARLGHARPAEARDRLRRGCRVAGPALAPGGRRAVRAAHGARAARAGGLPDLVGARRRCAGAAVARRRWCRWGGSSSTPATASPTTRTGPVRIFRDSGIPLTGPLASLDVWDHQMAISAAPGDPTKTLWRDRLVIGGPTALALWPVLWATWQWRAARIRALAPTWAHDPEPASESRRRVRRETCTRSIAIGPRPGKTDAAAAARPRHPTPVRPPTGRASSLGERLHRRDARRQARRDDRRDQRQHAPSQRRSPTTGQSGTAGQTNVGAATVAAGSSGIEPSSDCAPAQP